MSIEPQPEPRHALNSAESVGYWVNLRAPFGGRNIAISRKQVDEFLRDPDGFAARCFGVPLAAYREWVELDGRPLCAARTKRGSLCRSWCGPSYHDDAAAWLAAHRVGHCPTHGGELFGYDLQLREQKKARRLQRALGVSAKEAR